MATVAAGWALAPGLGLGSRDVFADVAGGASVDPFSVDWSAIDAILEKTAAEAGGGYGLTLFTKDQIFYEKAFGDYQLDSEDFLASATKLLSATAVMTVVDDGLIALDDPISKYLPQFGPSRGPITIRQLLAQTHGLPGSHKSIPPPHGRNGLTLAECVDLIAEEDTLNRPPGTEHHYEPPVAYQIAGRIAELVTRQDWNTLFEERIKQPLEMTTMTYGDTPNPRLGGGASCNMRDFTNLLQMHLNDGEFRGRRVLSATMAREMHKDQLLGVKFHSVPSHHHTEGYGLSWWFDIVDDEGRAVQTTVPGGFGAVPWINWELGYGGFLLTGCGHHVAVPAYNEIFPLVNTSLGLPTEPPEIPEQYVKVMKERIGTKCRRIMPPLRRGDTE
jgi:CubicO group peptidase (beta-lactamase class C family)